MRRKLFFLFLTTILLLTGCEELPTLPFLNPEPAPGPGGYAPRYEKSQCPFDAQGLEVECGYLKVPEDRANPGGPAIRLAVARFKASLPNPAPDPIVYLEGGPGGSPLRAYIKNYSVIFGPFNQKRDVILVDQRGTGYSQPALDCPEVTRLTLDQLNQSLPPMEADRQTNVALQACHERLKAQGINLGAYDSNESAADLDDLRAALKIKQWNLYGTSYGTRLALEVLRDHPQGIRSAVIDSVLPPSVDWYTNGPADFARALYAIFDACSAQPACNSAYPDLKRVFSETVKKLNAAPAHITITQPDLGGIGSPGRQLEALLDGNGFAGFIYQALYSSDLIPSIPAVIYMAKNGEYRMFAQLEGQFLSQYKDLSYGMYFSVKCADMMPFESPQQAEAAYQAAGDLANVMGTAQGGFESCKIWDVPPAPAAEDQPVKSDVPSLVIAGQFDPATPPEWARQAAAALSRSTLIEVPGAGHAPSMTQGCPQKIALAFFDTPLAAPDSTCLKETPLAFAVPMVSVDVKLAPFDNRLMGLSGLVPASWKAVPNIPGFYTPDGTALNSTQLMVQAAPMSADQILGSMRGQLESQGVALKPNQLKLSVQSAGGLKWTFYEADGGMIQIDLGLATAGKNTVLVVLQSPWNERGALVRAVFVPVVESIIGR